MVRIAKEKCLSFFFPFFLLCAFFLAGFSPIFCENHWYCKMFSLVVAFIIQCALSGWGEIASVY